MNAIPGKVLKSMESKGYEQLCENNAWPGGLHAQAREDGRADTLLKLSVAIDDDLKVLQPYL
jgi:hypothetical protein